MKSSSQRVKDTVNVIVGGQREGVGGSQWDGAKVRIKRGRGPREQRDRGIKRQRQREAGEC